MGLVKNLKLATFYLISKDSVTAKQEEHGTNKPFLQSLTLYN